MMQGIGGYSPDGRYAVGMARDHTVQFKDAFGEEMSPRVLAERMGQFVHQFTCYGGARPLGINLLFAGYDHREKKYDLYRITPTGQYYVAFPLRSNAQRHFAEAVGKGRQNCKADIEKYNLIEKTVDEVLPYVTKMYLSGMKVICRLCETHTESKKPYEIEIGYVSDATGHRFIRVEKERRYD